MQYERSGRLAADFRRMVAFWSIAKMILRDRCGTSSDLASLFCGRRSTSDRCSRKIARKLARGSALHSTFHF